MKNTDSTGVWVHDHVLPYVINGDSSGLSDDGYDRAVVVDDYLYYMAHSMVEDIDDVRDWSWHVSVTDERDEFRAPTPIPSYPTVDMAPYNLPGACTLVDVVVVYSTEGK